MAFLIDTDVQLCFLHPSKHKFEHPRFCYERLEYVGQKIQVMVFHEANSSVQFQSWIHFLKWREMTIFPFDHLLLLLSIGYCDGWEVAHEASWCSWEVATGEAPPPSYEQVLREVLEGQVSPPLYHLLWTGSGLVWTQSKTKEPSHDCCSTSHSWPLLPCIWETRRKTPHVWGFWFRANPTQTCIKILETYFNHLVS